jgi:Protein of unknown function (DUF1236)
VVIIRSGCAERSISTVRDVHNVNFDYHVGRRIPRHIHLFAIPAAVFAFFPYYEDCSYFVVNDDICIVDPRTYVVVDVIDAT